MEGNEMTQTISNKVYVLSQDTSHLIGDLDLDAWLIKFSGWENTVALCLPEEYELPGRIEFDAVLETMRFSDYPVNDVSWPIMSGRMLDVLLSVGHFGHKAFPVIIRDCEIASFKDGTAQVSGEELHHFFAVQVKEYLDIFDWERSAYELNPDSTDQVNDIEKLVLKDFGKNLPPVFRLSVYPHLLLVSAQARAALVMQGIQGTAFYKLDDLWSNSE